MASAVDDSEGRFHNASLATSVATRRHTAANTDNDRAPAALNATGLSLPLSVQTDTFVSVKRERTAHSVDDTLGNDAASPLDSLKLLQQKLDKIGAKRHNVGRVARTEVAGIQLEAVAYDARLERLRSVGQENGHGGRLTDGAHDSASKLAVAPAIVDQRRQFGSVERLRVDPRPPYEPSSESYQHSRAAAGADSPLAENNDSAGGGGNQSDDARSRSRHSDRQLKKMEDYKRRLKLEYKFVKEKYAQLSNEAKRTAKEPNGGAPAQPTTSAKRALASATKVLFADENARPNAKAAGTNAQLGSSGQVQPHTATVYTSKNAIAQTSILPNINERGNVAISDDFADLKRRLADMQQRFLNELDKHDASNQREPAAGAARVPAPSVQRSPCRQRRVRIATAASRHADALVDAPIAPTARLHFVPAKATGASHSLNANLQQFLSSLKAENPLLHHVCLRVGAHAPISKLIHACRAELAKRHQLLQADLDRKLRMYTAVKDRLDAMTSHGHTDAEVASAATDVHDSAHQVELADAALLRLDRQMARLDSLADTLQSPLAAEADRCGARKHRHTNKIVRTVPPRRSVVPPTLTQATIASQCKAHGHRAAQAHVDGAQHQRHTAALRNLRRLTEAMRA